MANTPICEAFIRCAVTDSSGTRSFETQPTRFGLGVGTNEVSQVLALPGSTFTAVTVPAGARAVLIRTYGAPSLTLKGVTGDAGLTLSPATNPIAGDMLLFLGTSPVFGFLNGSSVAATATLIFF